MNFERCKENPILKPNNNAWEDLCVLNPGVIIEKSTGKIKMLYRAAGNDFEHLIRLGIAESDDGIHFTRLSDEPAMDVHRDEADGGCLEDPRIVEIDGVYYITYAGRPFAPGRYWVEEDFKKIKASREKWPETAPWLLRNETVTYLACTKDFKTYKRLGRITDSRYDDRDVVIFPEKINGKFVMLSRPKRDEFAPSIWISYSDDLIEWGEPKKLFSGVEGWEKNRIGAGCPPIKTEDGWLLIYHGVSGEDHYYRVGMVMLDLNDPSKIIARTKDFVFEPQEEYETDGIWTGCVFPTGIIEKDGKYYIYYGCADKYVSLATMDKKQVLEHMRKCRV